MLFHLQILAMISSCIELDEKNSGVTIETREAPRQNINVGPLGLSPYTSRLLSASEAVSGQT